MTNYSYWSISEGCYEDKMGKKQNHEVLGVKTKWKYARHNVSSISSSELKQVYTGLWVGANKEYYRTFVFGFWYGPVQLPTFFYHHYLHSFIISIQIPKMEEKTKTEVKLSVLTMNHPDSCQFLYKSPR